MHKDFMMANRSFTEKTKKKKKEWEEKHEHETNIT